MTERDKALAGYLFRQGDPILAEERKKAQQLCFQFNHTDPTDSERKDEIIRELIGNIKGNYGINAPFYCDYGFHITLGNNFFANYNCKILDGAEVVFGDDVRIGPDCSFLTPNHAPDPQMRRDGYEIFQPITVGDNVWFGANVTVLPGVTIGSDSIIAAGSVVSRDIPSGVLAAGVPCRVIRKLDDRDRHKYPQAPDEFK